MISTRMANLQDRPGKWLEFAASLGQEQDCATRPLLHADTQEACPFANWRLNLIGRHLIAAS
ncbi:hypothetical protein ABTL12_20430, partial [Acinetobacter baumannii]